MTLETYFAYVKGDLRATRKAWLMSLVACAALVLVNALFSLTETDFEPAYYFALLFAANLPSLPYRRLIWGAPASKNVRMFCLGFLRGIPGSFPVLIYLLWLVPHFNVPVLVASRLKGYPILPRNALPSEYALVFGFCLLLFFYSEIYTAAIVVLDKKKGPKGKTQNLLLSLGLFLSAMGLAAILAWTVFCLFYDLTPSPLTWSLVVLAFPATAALLIWTYRSWAASD